MCPRSVVPHLYLYSSLFFFFSVHLLFFSVALFERRMIKEKIESHQKNVSFSLSEVKNCTFYFTIGNMITSKNTSFYSTMLSYNLYLSVFHVLLWDFFKISHSIKKICILQTWNCLLMKKVSRLNFCLQTFLGQMWSVVIASSQWEDVMFHMVRDNQNRALCPKQCTLTTHGEPLWLQLAQGSGKKEFRSVPSHTWETPAWSGQHGVYIFRGRRGCSNCLDDAKLRKMMKPVPAEALE